MQKPAVSPPAGGFGDRAVTHVLLQGGTQSTQSSLSSHRSQQLRPAEPHKSATEPNLHLRRQTAARELPLIREFTNQGLYAVIKEDKLITF